MTYGQSVETVPYDAGQVRQLEEAEQLAVEQEDFESAANLSSELDGLRSVVALETWMQQMLASILFSPVAHWWQPLLASQCFTAACCWPWHAMECTEPPHLALEVYTPSLRFLLGTSCLA